MEILPFGDSALLINVEQRIDLDINKEIIALNRKIKEQAIEGFLYSIPAYSSITIGYNPSVSSYQKFRAKLQEIIRDKIEIDIKTKNKTIKIPVCYDPSFGIDLEDIAKEIKLPAEEVVSLHSNLVYNTYMIGFLPGFAYLGKVDEKLHLPRKSTPRLKVPARSVAIAGAQTAIYPIESPGGWHLLGKTPLDIFQPRRDNPFLISAGDQIKFESIVLDQYHAIRTKVERGTYNYKLLDDVGD